MNPAPDLKSLGYRLVCSEIRTANREHTLDCGCKIKPGTPYHRVAAIYSHKPKSLGRQMIYYKQHIVGCLETLH